MNQPARPFFEVGTTVQLISGGPIMTIVKLNRETISCAWFDQNDAKHQSTFAPTALAKVNYSTIPQEKTDE